MPVARRLGTFNVFLVEHELPIISHAPNGRFRLAILTLPVRSADLIWHTGYFLLPLLSGSSRANQGVLDGQSMEKQVETVFTGVAIPQRCTG